MPGTIPHLTFAALRALTLRTLKAQGFSRCLCPAFPLSEVFHFGLTMPGGCDSNTYRLAAGLKLTGQLKCVTSMIRHLVFTMI